MSLPDDAPLLPVSVATPKVDTNALAYAMARNASGAKLPLGDVLLSFNIALDTPGLRNLLTSAAFKQRYAAYVREMVESGESFKLKARVQAEDLLTHSYEIATDPETPASVRADLIKWTAAVAGLGPPKEQQKGEGASQSAGFTLNISFGGQPALAAGSARPAIDVTPTRES